MNQILQIYSLGMTSHIGKEFISNSFAPVRKIIENQYIHQAPSMIYTTFENTNNYLNELAIQVSDLESKVDNPEDFLNKLKIAFENPYIAIDFKDTLLRSAKTNVK